MIDELIEMGKALLIVGMPLWLCLAVGGAAEILYHVSKEVEELGVEEYNLRRSMSGIKDFLNRCDIRDKEREQNDEGN